MIVDIADYSQVDTEFDYDTLEHLFHEFADPSGLLMSEPPD